MYLAIDIIFVYLEGMKTNETYTQLLTMISKNEPSAYQVLYEAVTSTLHELAKSWSENSHDITDKQLTVESRLSKRIRHELNDRGYSIEYEAGRLSGIVEAFEYLYRASEDIKIIDDTLSKSLSNSKPASKTIIRILYKSSKGDEWVSNARLASECSQSASALSNIMKRLIQAGAVEFLKEGRTISYRITAAGKRYYENMRSSQVEDSIACEIEELKEKTEELQKTLDSLLTKPEQKQNFTYRVRNLIGLGAYSSLMKTSILSLDQQDENLKSINDINKVAWRYLNNQNDTIMEGL